MLPGNQSLQRLTTKGSPIKLIVYHRKLYIFSTMTSRISPLFLSIFPHFLEPMMD
jgi:hypothetical protein